MRCLNEPIARMANKEDQCTGRFWEGRFKSQALLDEAAVLSCMAYVDLNPIRAKIAKTPETSDHTSLKLRINAAINKKQPAKLLPFIGNETKNMPKGINFNLQDYLSLVEATGKVIRANKRGYIEENHSDILTRLNISSDDWLKLTTDFGNLFHGPVGNLQQLTIYCAHLEKKRRHFLNSCKHLA